MGKQRFISAEDPGGFFERADQYCSVDRFPADLDVLQPLQLATSEKARELIGVKPE